MNISAWLQTAQQKLEAADIATARLDALVLLEDELHTDRTHLLAHPEINLTTENIKVLDAQIARRVIHEPLAYVRGHTEFYGREFIVSATVLEPRPESETMIELLKMFVKNSSTSTTRHPKHDLGSHPKKSDQVGPHLLDSSLRWNDNIYIADVGAGSGALGITAKLELPNSTVDLLELDEGAIEIAKRNVIKFATPIKTIRSNLLSAAAQSYEVLLCNLPYVPDDHTINEAAMYEPRIAIFGGPDGLDLYRRLFKQVLDLEAKPLLILTEALPPQHGALVVIARSAGYNQQQEDDFIQAFVPNKS